VGLERGPLSLASTIEELLGRKSSDCGLESREYCPLCKSVLSCKIARIPIKTFRFTNCLHGGMKVGGGGLCSLNELGMNPIVAVTDRQTRTVINTNYT
jgi:hypothetical protein